jgi:PPOX class probable F420-dependent enzyme
MVDYPGRARRCDPANTPSVLVQEATVLDTFALPGATEAQEAFLLAARVGHLATVGLDACPHAVPVCFALAGGRIYTPLDEKPKRVAPRRLQRVRDIAVNPSVCLVVDRYSEDWSLLAWIQIRADAAIVDPSGSDHAAAVEALRLRYAQYAAMRLEQLPLLRLNPRRIVSWGL